MINSQTKPKIFSDILWRKDGPDDELVVLASCNDGPIRFLNPVGGIIIEMSNGKNTYEDIVNYIISIFQDVDIKTVEKDVEMFLKTLKKNKIIEF
jgi:hypothetical protein